MDMDIDIETGMPELPENQYWRVTGWFSATYRVALKQKTWYGSKELANWASFKSGGKDGIKWAARLALRYSKETKNRKKDPLVGNYPPRSIK